MYGNLPRTRLHHPIPSRRRRIPRSVDVKTPENRSFEEVKLELAEQVLPLEKRYQFQKLLVDLKNRDGVFMYGTAGRAREESQ